MPERSVSTLFWMLFAGLAWRLAGAGMELAGAVVGLCLLGYWIDRHFESSPWGLLICALIGIGAVLAWQAVPERGASTVARQDFSVFPARLGGRLRQRSR